MPVIILAIASLFPSFPPATAQEAPPALLNHLREQLGSSNHNADRARTGRQRSGSTRDLCPVTNPSLTAVVPATNGGQTIAAHPTLWFYVPFAASMDHHLEFVLIRTPQNGAEEDIYRAQFALSGTPGMVRIAIPESITLNPGEPYHWVVSLTCSPVDPLTDAAVQINRSGDLTVNGWIQRIEPAPELLNQLQAASQEDRIRLYANYDLWYDLVQTLATLRQQEPANQAIAATWIGLLQLESVGLSDIASMPLTSCCQSISPRSPQ